MEQKPTGENPGNAQTNPEIILSSPSTGSIPPAPEQNLSELRYSKCFRGCLLLQMWRKITGCYATG